MSIYKEITGQGEEIVLMHGWGCSHLHMQPIVEMLSNTRRVTNVDLPGCGESDWDTTIQSINDMADLLINELPEKAIYIGWSVGGLVSMSIAGRFPERVMRLIGIGSTPKFVEDNAWQGIPQPGFSAALEQMKQLGYREFFKQFYEEEFQGYQEKPNAFYDLMKIMESDSAKNIEVLSKGIAIIDQADLREEFNKIQCPIDLILGEKDSAVPVGSINQLEKLNRSIQVHIIPEARHMIQWTNPSELKEILKNILMDR